MIGGDWWEVVSVEEVHRQMVQEVQGVWDRGDFLPPDRKWFSLDPAGHGSDRTIEAQVSVVDGELHLEEVDPRDVLVTGVQAGGIGDGLRLLLEDDRRYHMIHPAEEMPMRVPLNDHGRGPKQRYGKGKKYHRSRM